MTTVTVAAQETPLPLSDDEFDLILHSGNPNEYFKIVVMTDEQAKWLVESSGYNKLREVWLNGLTSISEKQARILSGFRGNILRLNGIDSLTDGQMKALCKLRAASTTKVVKYSGGEIYFQYSTVAVFLDGLTWITDKQAKHLSTMNVTDLSLAGLTSLSNRQVKALKNAIATSIYLDGITDLAEEQLKTLASSDIKFGLRGLGRDGRTKFKSYGGKLVKRSERP
jgi:hypothetical protein